MRLNASHSRINVQTTHKRNLQFNEYQVLSSFPSKRMTLPNGRSPFSFKATIITLPVNYGACGSVFPYKPIMGARQKSFISLEGMFNGLNEREI